MKKQARIESWERKVADAERAFEARWTRMGLKAVDEPTSLKLEHQRNLYIEARTRGLPKDFIRHAGGMVRGYQIASEVMMAYIEQASVVSVCRSLDRETTLVISDDLDALARAETVYGEGRVIWLTPVELAELFQKVPALQAVADVKLRFPGTEILRVTPTTKTAPEEGAAVGLNEGI